MKPAVVFIGFMGAGKSTALAAARAAGLASTEIDDLMEASFGKPIEQAFREDGEAAFRAREAEVVGELLENADGGAIALGGGSVMIDRVRAALGRHVVVWLQVDPAESWRRIAHSKRPLATSEDDVRELLATRLPLYEELADAVVPMGDREIVERALPAVQALAGMPSGTRMLWAVTAAAEYPVFVGRDLFASGWWPLSGRRFCIADETTMGLFSDWLEPLEARVTVPPGEDTKSMAEAERVLEQLAHAGMIREDHVVALGGGVIGDFGGFCAHLYQRGAPVVHIPTTLVSQVDSAYGGKTGVDLPEGKNYIGAYQQPAAVFADLRTLDTLPGWEMASGFVEALKTGLLAGGRLWEQVRAVTDVAAAPLDEIVFACARYKSAVVAADERESGLRAVLNLGHTVGHAIETASRYQQHHHGEAIGLGLLAALRLSEAAELRDEVEGILDRLALPTALDPELLPVDAVMESMSFDKKRTAAGLGFVLLAEPGEPRTGQLVPESDVLAAVEELYA